MDRSYKDLVLIFWTLLIFNQINCLCRRCSKLSKLEGATQCARTHHTPRTHSHIICRDAHYENGGMDCYGNLWEGVLLKKVKSDIVSISESLPQKLKCEGKKLSSKWVLLEKDRAHQGTSQTYQDNWLLCWIINLSIESIHCYMPYLRQKWYGGQEKNHAS